ncbi:S41 family peptidase [Flavobacterium sp. MFBS3-15]|uniref:S41 family peptidase n=1 Tax=Flavobacterium sp. MFBS3-15 TaxID=2989816 RepID=UPI0022364FF7|nr:S41 family peptidase [Flavobacterium sp. MFBS3-15]MCW4467486.1 S41 family peptidase [Flavobacterium sp. MFBS3-15]
MLSRFLLLFFAGMLCFACTAQTSKLPDSVRVHIDSSLTILKQNSLYGKKVDWKKVEADVYARAAGSRTTEDAFDALIVAFEATGDKHAAYYSGNKKFQIPHTDLLARYSDSLKANQLRGWRIVHRMIGGMAYVSIPAMPVNKQEEIEDHANRLYGIIAGMAKNNPEGWIIDLRCNEGGNIRPMMAGLAMFFPDGIMSCYIDRDGNAAGLSGIADGEFQMEGVTQAFIKNKMPSLKDAKVAVLIGPGTASSGEGVASNFRQRKNTRLFGQDTGGFANSTLSFTFNNNQTYFLISTHHIGDSNKKPLPEFVTPHETITGVEAYNDLQIDSAVMAAIRWLKK